MLEVFRVRSPSGGLLYLTNRNRKECYAHRDRNAGDYSLLRFRLLDLISRTGKVQ